MSEPIPPFTAEDDDARAKHLSQEWLSVEKALDKARILHTIVFFGSARIEDRHAAHMANDKAAQLSAGHPENNIAKQAQHSAALTFQQSQYYEDARQLAKKIGQYLYQCNNTETKLVTGGGPGIMEAANRGASEIGQESIGLNIIIPKEQMPNPYITQEYSFSFHYFSLRKMHFLKRAKAIVVFPGGFGTLDELMEVLTLIQTGKVPKIPVVLYGEEFWNKVINFNYLAEQQLIDEEDLQLYTIVNEPDEAFELIVGFIHCTN